GRSPPEGLAMAIDLSRGPHDVSELRSIETRPADEAAVTVRQLHVRLDVAGVDTPSIKDADLASGAGADHLAHDLADQPHRLVGVLRVCVLARGHGPDGR